MSSLNGKSMNGSRPAEVYAHIVGWGMAVPERVVPNDEIARFLDTTDEWIVSRTGIRERRIAGPKETTATLAIRAAQQALEVADVSPAEIDMIVVATSTPEHVFPSTACLVQDALGAGQCGAFDLSAACSGFIYALGIGSQAIRSGAADTVLIIGSETMSRILNWKDRGTCILFGDGAGAFVLQRRSTPGGVLSCTMRSDGSGADLLQVPAGGSRMPASLETVQEDLHTIRMNGREVFRFATRVMVSACREAMQLAGLRMEDVDVIVPHQANRRIVEAASRSLGLPQDKFIMNLDRYGNTSSASVPIAVCEAVADGRIRPNSNVVMVAFGGGLTWASAAIHWDVEAPRVLSGWEHFRRQTQYGWAHVRSAARRVLRRVEGVLWGSQSPEVSQRPPQEKDGGE